MDMDTNMDRNTNIDPDLEQAYALFLADLDATESALPLPAAMAEYVALAREGAFQAGWRAHREAVQPGAEPEAASTVRGSTRPTVRALVDLGDHAWVHPFAVIEHAGTGECFIDPWFPLAEEESDEHCIALTVTEVGLVASGPPDCHRLSPDVARARLLPLVDFEPLPLG